MFDPKVVMKEHNNKQIPTLEYQETDSSGGTTIINRYPPQGSRPQSFMRPSSKRYRQKPK